MKVYFVISSPSKQITNTFLECGVKRVLTSYAEIGGKDNIKLPFEEVMIDSGAFGVETGTQEVTVRTYGLWLELYLSQYPQIKTYVNLDDISSVEESKKNQEYLESCGLKPMPVYHYGEPAECLDELCNKYQYVGIGGLVTKGLRTQDLKTFWEWIYERYPDNIFHMFGATNMMAYIKYQPYSIDSSSWCSAGKYRNLMGYRDGLPAQCDLPGERNGWQLFFSTTELWAHNIRAILDYESLNWIKNIKNNNSTQKQQRML